MRIGLVGHSGFVGQAVSAELRRHGHEVAGLARVCGDTLLRASAADSHRMFDRATEGLGRELEGVDLIVNCAGETVARRSERSDESHLANVVLPSYIYRQSLAAGVPRFVHISSVAAIGSSTSPGTALSDQDHPSPDKAYGKSKLAGDEHLLAIAERTTALTILRPPILYGAQARGVFRLFRKAARHGLPLPIGGLRNRRSFMFVDNLASAILAAAERELTGPYIVTDHRPVTPGELYDLMTSAAGKGKRSFALPRTMVSFIAKLVLRERSESLLGDAVYDDSRFRQESGWLPPYSLENAFGAVMRR